MQDACIEPPTLRCSWRRSGHIARSLNLKTWASIQMKPCEGACGPLPATAPTAHNRHLHREVVRALSPVRFWT